MFRSLSIVMTLTLIAGSTAFAIREKPKTPGETAPKTERERDEARRKAQTEQATRTAQNRLQFVSDYAHKEIPGFRRTMQLEMAIKHSDGRPPHTVQILDAVSNVRTPYKPLRLSELINDVVTNVKSGQISAQQTSLAQQAIVFASAFARVPSNTTDALVQRAYDAAFRQMETLVEMTKPGFAEKKPNEISSTMEFLQKFNELQKDNLDVAQIYILAIKATRGNLEDMDIIRREIEDIASCKNG